MSEHVELAGQLRDIFLALSAGEAAAVERFFTDATVAGGVVAMDATEGPFKRGVGVIVNDDDPVLGRCFELRDRLDEQTFQHAWRLRDASWGMLGHPTRPHALVRYAITADLTPPGASTPRPVRRGLLLDVEEIPAVLLRRFGESGTMIWGVYGEFVRKPGVRTRDEGERRSLARGPAGRRGIAGHPRCDCGHPGRDLRGHRQRRAAGRSRPQRRRRADRAAARRGVRLALPTSRARRRGRRGAHHPGQRDRRRRLRGRAHHQPPLAPQHLLALALAGAAGVIGNAIAARVRLSGGRRLDSPALIADGQHARSDAIVSLGVVISATVVALGAPIADPLIGLAITALILHITWESWQTVRGRGHHC